jgi:hypothetical protein
VSGYHPATTCVFFLRSAPTTIADLPVEVGGRGWCRRPCVGYRVVASNVSVEERTRPLTARCRGHSSAPSSSTLSQTVARARCSKGCWVNASLAPWPPVKPASSGLSSAFARPGCLVGYSGPAGLAAVERGPGVHEHLRPPVPLWYGEHASQPVAVPSRARSYKVSGAQLLHDRGGATVARSWSINTSFLSTGLPTAGPWARQQAFVGGRHTTSSQLPTPGCRGGEQPGSEWFGGPMGTRASTGRPDPTHPCISVAGRPAIPSCAGATRGREVSLHRFHNPTRARSRTPAAVPSLLGLAAQLARPPRAIAAARPASSPLPLLSPPALAAGYPPPPATAPPVVSSPNRRTRGTTMTTCRRPGPAGWACRPP